MTNNSDWFPLTIIPPDDVTILLSNSNGFIGCGRRKDISKKWWRFIYGDYQIVFYIDKVFKHASTKEYDYEITHWRYIPEAPTND